MHENFTSCVYVDREELITFGKLPACGNFLKKIS